LNRVSRDIEKRVFEMHFNGIPRDNIARELGLSSATVSAILSILPPNLNNLRELSVELRKSNMIARDALQGVNILNSLRTLRVKPNQVNSSLQAVFKISADTGYKPEDVVQAATKLVELEIQSGNPYPEAIEQLELLCAKIHKQKLQNKKYKEQNSRLIREIEENKLKRNETLKQANIAPEEIAEYHTVKEALHSYGVKMKDTKNLCNYLDNMKETGFNPHFFVSFTKKQGSIKKTLASTEAQTQHSQENLTAFQNIERQKKRAVLLLASEENRLLKTVQDLNMEAYLLQSQRTQLVTECWELENLRKALTVITARKSGIPERYIQDLQLENHIDVLIEQIKQKFQNLVQDMR
jgi:hypothetical protein